MKDHKRKYCCWRFKEGVEERKIVHASGTDETEWFFTDWLHLYYCPFCGSLVKGKGAGRFHLDQKRLMRNQSVPFLGKEWTGEDLSRLKALARMKTPAGVIGLKLDRTEGAVRAKAWQAGVSLGPWNQAPPARKKK